MAISSGGLVFRVTFMLTCILKHSTFLHLFYVYVIIIVIPHACQGPSLFAT